MTETPLVDLRCFQNFDALYCKKKECKPRAVALGDVLAQVEKGHTKCAKCSASIDMRESFANFATLGTPEALFGLRAFHLRKDFSASTAHAIDCWDLRRELPHEGEIIYATVTPSAKEWTGPNEAPSLLAPQRSYSPWSLDMRVHVPPGGARRLSIVVVVKPMEPLDPPREIAIQAIQAFHREQFGIASALLVTSVEMTLRDLVETGCSARGVDMPNRPGFDALLTHARLMFDPQLGSHIVGDLKDLTKRGRNRLVHAGDETKVDQQDVARWMIDVACIYEWSRHARGLGSPT